MKTKITLLILFLFALTLSLSSCDKDETEEVPPTKRELITKAIWNYDKFEIYKDNSLLNTIPGNGLTIDFKTNGEYYMYNSDGSQNYHGYWDINSDGNKIYFYDEEEGTEAYMMYIQELTENSFIFYSLEQMEDIPKIVKKQYVDTYIEKIVVYLSR